MNEMKLKTSSFSKRKDEDDIVVSISRMSPRWGKIEFELKGLSPSYQLLKKIKNGEIEEKEYIEIFNKEVGAERYKIAVEEIKKISAKNKNKTIVLCCYENERDFCHRHIVAERLERELDTKIEEKGCKMTKREKGRIVWK